VRPLNLGETLDASIKIVSARWRTLVTVMVVVLLPIQLIDMFIISSTTDVYQAGSGLTGSGSATTYDDEGAYLTGQFVIQVLGLVGNLVGTVACYRAVADSYLGRETTPGDSLRFASRRALPTLWLTILYVVLLIPAFFFFLVPGIWLLIAWSVAVPVLLVEGHGGIGALKRSFALVKDRWWATCGRLVVAYILVGVITTVVTALLLGVATAAVDDTSFGALVLEHLANLLVSLITTPFLAAVVTLVYFDLRVRKEGFDLAVLAERMGGPRAEGPAPVAAGGSGFGAPAAERDAFGNAATSVPPPAPRPAPRAPTPPPGERPSGLPEGWTPPVAPEPRRPPTPDE
jgi:hypothetical protein